MLSQDEIAEMARKHDVSAAAVAALAKAISQGGGNLAQFSHPELGGSGQWMKSGMLMIGDMFNDRLKSRVAALCLDVADALGERPPATEHGSRRSADWWPADLGFPSSVGSQNAMRYAFFPTTRRLLIHDNGEVRLFDTGEHVITGAGQQQSGRQSLSFSTAHGLIDIASLRRVE